MLLTKGEFMNKKLSKVAKYLGSQGFHVEAAQLQKLAGKMSDWSPYSSPQFDGPPAQEEDYTREYLVEVPEEATVAELKTLESRIKSVCKRFGCEISWDTKVIEGREVYGLSVELEHVSDTIDSQTPIERIGEEMGLDIVVHNLREL